MFHFPQYPEATGGDGTDTTAQDDAQTPTSDDADVASEEQGTEQATSTEEEESPETAPGDEEGEGEEGADLRLDELSDEDLEALLAAYKDRFLKSKDLQSEIEKLVRRQVERQVSERTRGYEAETAEERLIEQGKQAARSVASLADLAQKELAKAAKGEDFNADLFKPEEMVRHLGEYGTAVQSIVNNQFDMAIQAAWESVFSDEGLPALSEEQAEELADVLETFNRMKGDPRQAPKSKDYFFSSLLQFVAARGAEFGAAQERDRAAKAKTVSEKIAGKNALAAAKAKLESARRPPSAPKSKPTPKSGDLMEAYREAKKAGDKVRAQELVDEMALQGIR